MASASRSRARSADAGTSRPPTSVSPAAPSTMACVSAGETPRRTGRSATRAPSRRRATSAGSRSAGRSAPNDGGQAAPRRGGTGSRMVPPPIVVTGLKLRSTNRSPPRATTGVSRASLASVETWPWPSGRRWSRAITSVVPRLTLTRLRSASRSFMPGSDSSLTSRARDDAQGASGITARSPLRTPARSTPARPIAVRAPGWLRSTAAPKVSIDRILPSLPSGRSRITSPTATLPDHAVPVITVPIPGTEKARSTGIRKRSRGSRGRGWAAWAAIAVCSAERPSPLEALTARGTSKATLEPETHAPTSAVSSSSHSGSARSALVITAIPRGMPSCSTMARCSRV